MCGRRRMAYVLIGLVAVVGVAGALWLRAAQVQRPLVPEQGARWIAIEFLANRSSHFYGSKVEGWSVVDDHYQSNDLVVTDHGGSVLSTLGNKCSGRQASPCHHGIWVVELTAQLQPPLDPSGGARRPCYRVGAFVVINATFGWVDNWVRGCIGDD